MERARILKELIEATGMSVKAFSETIDVPYTTVHSILSRGVGKASIDNVLKMCRALGITTEEMERLAARGSHDVAIASEPRNDIFSTGRGAFLANLIKEKGFTAFSLSEASGVPLATIRSMIERDLNNASIDNVLHISKILGVDADALAEPEVWLAKARNSETIAAHHETGEWTEEELRELERYKEFMRSKRNMG